MVALVVLGVVAAEPPRGRAFAQQQQAAAPPYRARGFRPSPAFSLPLRALPQQAYGPPPQPSYGPPPQEPTTTPAPTTTEYSTEEATTEPQVCHESSSLCFKGGKVVMIDKNSLQRTKLLQATTFKLCKFIMLRSLLLCCFIHYIFFRVKTSRWNPRIVPPRKRNRESSNKSSVGRCSSCSPRKSKLNPKSCFTQYNRMQLW